MTESGIFENRLATLRLSMAERGFDRLIVSTPENLFYLTGYDGWSFYLHQCLVVSQRDTRLIWIGRASDVGVASSRPGIRPGDAIVYPDSYLHSDLRHPYDFVAETLRTLGMATGTLAVPIDAYHFTPAAYFALEKGMPNSRLTTDLQVVNWQRVRKSAAEQELMREAARIGEAALVAGAATVRAGALISATAGEILRAQTGATIQADGGYPAIMPLIIDGNGPARPHDTWRNVPYDSKGPVILELAGVHQRYHAPMARTVFIGAPDPLHKAALNAQIACMESLESIAHAGAKAGDIAKELAVTLAAHGFTKSGRFGYSTGIAYPPDWGEHTLSIRDGDEALLEEGMTLFFIPGLWGKEWSVVLGDTFVIGARGAQRLGSLPYEI